MITVIARWDTTQADPRLEQRMYRQLKGAYAEGDSANFRLIFVPVADGVGGEQYSTMEEALAQATGEKVFLEGSASKLISEIPKGDVTIIVGNTEHGNSEYAQDDEMYKIPTPASVDLYGVNAVAIALDNWNK